ncbi:MAG TPA: Imm1 family immunity protein [Pseudonocardiaceae bacterium]|jgi:hypothetical protein|nr:Imm1 family immunity protein [Pseudonocardiaceae bacterium]
MGDHVVTGRGIGSVCPYVVATGRHQRTLLVDMLLTTPAGLLGDPRLHSGAHLSVGPRPSYETNTVRPWLRVGFHDGFGAAFFCDETTPAGQDWAWAAIAEQPLDNPPTVYFDQDAETAFPPCSVMPLDRLRVVVLEWVDTGRRPTGVRWLPVNSLAWRIDDTGQARPVTDVRS